MQCLSGVCSSKAQGQDLPFKCCDEVQNIADEFRSHVKASEDRVRGELVELRACLSSIRDRQEHKNDGVEMQSYAGRKELDASLAEIREWQDLQSSRVAYELQESVDELRSHGKVSEDRLRTELVELLAVIRDRQDHKQSEIETKCFMEAKEVNASLAEVRERQGLQERWITELHARVAEMGIGLTDLHKWNTGLHARVAEMEIGLSHLHKCYVDACTTLKELPGKESTPTTIDTVVNASTTNPCRPADMSKASTPSLCSAANENGNVLDLTNCTTDFERRIEEDMSCVSQHIAEASNSLSGLEKRISAQEDVAQSLLNSVRAAVEESKAGLAASVEELRTLLNYLDQREARDVHRLSDELCELRKPLHEMQPAEMLTPLPSPVCVLQPQQGQANDLGCTVRSFSPAMNAFSRSLSPGARPRAVSWQPTASGSASPLSLQPRHVFCGTQASQRRAQGAMRDRKGMPPPSVAHQVAEWPGLTTPTLPCRSSPTMVVRRQSSPSF